jgi:hypothetical protein
LRNAFASIWRMRSRVTLKNAPTSSSVRCAPSSVSPKRRRITFASRGVSVRSTSFTSSRSIADGRECAGLTDARVLDEVAEVRVVVLADRAVERDRLLRALRIAFTLSTGSSSRSAISSGVGLAPSSCTSRRDTRTDAIDVLDHVAPARGSCAPGRRSRG